jgi:peptidoglycan/xylan/chitin deacetylase (PgdA/CDA1 family)/GT2 family glycosyltransferase
MSELSVIIPTYNRRDRLRRCLEALAHQTQAATDFDVIVVDDGSTDSTAEMLAHFKTPFALRVIHQPKSGQSAALKRGAEAADRYCLFLDDDVIAGCDLVAEHYKTQHANAGSAAIGQLTTRPPASADWFARCFAQDWSDHYARLNQGVCLPRWSDCYSGNMSVPRQTLLEVGSYAADLPANFDVELGYRLQQHGVPIIYLPAAQGEHADYKDYRRLLYADEREGRMLPEMVRRHPTLLAEYLSTFWDTSARAIWLRQFLLTLKIRPQQLARLKPPSPYKHWTWEWFRFLRAYAFWYGVQHALSDRETWRRMMYRTPILMYHAFGSPDERPSRFIIPAQRFARQMAWLKHRHYQVLSLSEFLSYQYEHRLPPERSVVITIDDGYTDVHRLAHPILKRYHFPATLFVISDQVGTTNQWDQLGELAGRPLSDWPDLKQLACAGVEIGAHSRTHPHLKTLSTEQAWVEISGSRANIERELAMPVRAFAYPYGEFDQASESAVKQAEFLGSCSVRPDLATAATSPHALPRIEIRGTDSLLDFILKLRWGRGVRSAKRSKARDDERDSRNERRQNESLADGH